MTFLWLPIQGVSYFPLFVLQMESNVSLLLRVPIRLIKLVVWSEQMAPVDGCQLLDLMLPNVRNSGLVLTPKLQIFFLVKHMEAIVLQTVPNVLTRVPALVILLKLPVKRKGQMEFVYTFLHLADWENVQMPQPQMLSKESQPTLDVWLSVPRISVQPMVPPVLPFKPVPHIQLKLDALKEQMDYVPLWFQVLLLSEPAN